MSGAPPVTAASARWYDEDKAAAERMAAAVEKRIMFFLVLMAIELEYTVVEIDNDSEHIGREYTACEISKLSNGKHAHVSSPTIYFILSVVKRNTPR